MDIIILTEQEINATYLQDNSYFTQGLVYYQDNILIQSNGLYNNSSIIAYELGNPILNNTGGTEINKILELSMDSLILPDSIVQPLFTEGICF